MNDYGPHFEQQRRTIYLPVYTRRVPLVTQKSWAGVMFLLGMLAGSIITGIYGMPAASMCVDTPECVRGIR